MKQHNFPPELEAAAMPQPDPDNGEMEKPCPTCAGDKTLSWLDDLNADNHQLIQHKGWADINAAMDAYRHLERFRGRALTVPEDDRDDAGWRKFYEKAGAPRQAADYVIDLPGELQSLFPADNSYLQEIAQLSHDLGLLPRQARLLADKLVRMAMRHQAETRRHGAITRRQRRDESLRQLESEWGPRDSDAFRANIALARRAYDHLADEGVIAEGDELGLLDIEDGPSNPGMVRAMAHIGKSLFAEGDYADADAAHSNPFTKDGFNLTMQGRLLNEDPVRAKAMIRRAGLDPARYNLPG